MENASNKLNPKSTAENKLNVEGPQLNVLIELLQTEANYIQVLGTLSTYKSEFLNSKAFSEGEIDVLCGNLEELIIGHDEFKLELQNQLQLHSISYDVAGWTEIKANVISNSICEAFEKVAPGFIVIYSLYAERLSSSMKFLENLSEDHVRALRTIESKVIAGIGLGLRETIDMSFASLIIQPIQRLCRYTLFFASLEKSFLNCNATSTAATQAAHVACEIAQEVNKRKAASDRKLRLRAIAETVKGFQVHSPLSVEEFLQDKELFHEWKGECKIEPASSSKQKALGEVFQSKNALLLVLTDFILILDEGRMKGLPVIACLSLAETVLKMPVLKCKGDLTSSVDILTLLHIYEIQETFETIKMKAGLRTVQDEKRIKKHTVIDKYSFSIKSVEELKLLEKAIMRAKGSLVKQQTRIKRDEKSPSYIRIKPPMPSILQPPIQSYKIQPPNPPERLRCSSLGQYEPTLAGLKKGEIRERGDSAPVIYSDRQIIEMDMKDNESKAKMEPATRARKGQRLDLIQTSDERSVSTATMRCSSDAFQGTGELNRARSEKRESLKNITSVCNIMEDLTRARSTQIGKITPRNDIWNLNPPPEQMIRRRRRKEACRWKNTTKAC